jgi:hypothetical protein
VPAQIGHARFWQARQILSLHDNAAGVGYKIVQVKAKDPVKTLPEYDEAIMKEFGGNTVSTRPTSSVVRTVGE